MEVDESPAKSQDTAETSSFLSNYTNVSHVFEDFFRLANLGDLNTIYRNRGCYINEKEKKALVEPAIQAFVDFPVSRPAVYFYTGHLVHECVHYWFNVKENVQQSTDVTILEEATKDVLDFFSQCFTHKTGKFSLEECLSWLCELCSEISQKNAGRASMPNTAQNDQILDILKSNKIISKVLSLINMIVTTSLDESPDGCMKALFEASRHGQHFSWIWLHLANFLKGAIIAPLLDSGADQFKVYVADLTHRKSVQSSPAVLTIIQTEYEYKFKAISDVFNFLMSKRNPELQEAVSQMILDTLDIRVEKASDRPATPTTHVSSTNRLGFAFFFKLVTCSLQTLQILVNSNCHLITPFNVIRAIRHVQAVDKSIVLPSASYSDFIRQIVSDVDPVTHGIIFELLIELVLDPDVFVGENIEELEKANQEIKDNAFPILNIMIDRIVRIAHSTANNKCASLHPAIQLYSSGERLQFIIDSVTTHFDNQFRTSSIIRHLHAIAIANSEAKGAEIALRFLMTINHKTPKVLIALMAYLQCTVPFYPKMLQYMWQEFSGLKIIIEQSFNRDDPAKIVEQVTILKNLLRNIKTIVDWEFYDGSTLAGNSFGFWELYPGEHIGLVINVIITEANQICWELTEEGKFDETMEIYKMITSFLESIRESNSDIRNNAPYSNKRTLMFPIADVYKTMAVFSIMLRNTLKLVRNDNPNGVVCFEELRSKALYFLFGGHIDETILSKFSPLFLNFFITACFIDSKKLFNDRIGESMETLLDETGLSRLADMGQIEDGAAILQGLKNIKMRDTAVSMIHKGQLKKRRNDIGPVPIMEDENAKLRVHVILDVINLMCNSGVPSITLACSKQLSLALIQVVCKDALMMDMRFDEWDNEAEFIHRHVETTQRIINSTLCDGLLRILSGTRSFGYCLPIIKSQLAILLNETEKFPDRKSMGEPLRKKLHTWVLLAQKGGLLPDRLGYICDLEQFATCHETHLMLLEIWKYFMARNLTQEMVDSYHLERLRDTIDEGLPNEREAIEKVNFSTFRIIIQNHLPATVTLFPKFFPLEYEFLKRERTEI